MKLLPHERIDDLQIKGFSIIQDTRGFCFGLDAVLLSSFPEIKKGDKVFDMCTGSGIVPILLAAKTDAASILGMEIMPEVANMAKRSVLMNGLSHVEIVHGDIKTATEVLGHGVFDVVTCNPPYKRASSGLVCADDMRTVARHEILCTLEDVISQGSGPLRFGGKLCMVHRPERLCDIVCLMRKYKTEPKRLRYVHPSPDKPPMLILIEGARGGREFLKTLPPLFVHDSEGNKTAEIEGIYGS